MELALVFFFFNLALERARSSEGGKREMESIAHFHACTVLHKSITGNKHSFIPKIYHNLHRIFDRVVD